MLGTLGFCWKPCYELTGWLPGRFLGLPKASWELPWSFLGSSEGLPRAVWGVPEGSQGKEPRSAPIYASQRIPRGGQLRNHFGVTFLVAHTSCTTLHQGCARCARSRKACPTLLYVKMQAHNLCTTFRVQRSAQPVHNLPKTAHNVERVAAHNLRVRNS